MSQDNQNQNPQDDRQNPDQPQNQGEEWQGDPQGSEETREAGPVESESEPLQGGVNSPDLTPAADDLDDMDDEDRDEDSRLDGSPNRRHNIG